MCSSHVLVVCGAGVLAIAIGMYLNWQCPPPSARLIEWKNKDASYFTHKRRTIFYKGWRRLGLFSTLEFEVLALFLILFQV